MTFKPFATLCDVAFDPCKYCDLLTDMVWRCSNTIGNGHDTEHCARLDHYIYIIRLRILQYHMPMLFISCSSQPTSSRRLLCL